MARDAAVWFVMIDGLQTGPLSRVELGLEFARGMISGETHVWKEGMSDWLPCDEVPEIAALFAPEVKPPPPPPPSAKAKAAGPRPMPSKPAQPKAAAAKPQEHGKGIKELDTGHFKLAELQAEDTGLKQLSEFNTAHFRVHEAHGKNIEDALQKVAEFDTSHFRLKDLPGGQKPKEEPLALQLDTPEYKRGVEGYPGAPGSVAKAQPAKAPFRIAPKPKPPPEPAFDPTQTAVEIVPLGEQVHQEKLAGELFDSSGPGDSVRPATPPAPIAAPPRAGVIKPADMAAQVAAVKARAKRDEDWRKMMMILVIGGGAVAALLFLFLVFR